jgi:hypothetical protein
MEKLLNELMMIRSNTKNGYFLITFDPKIGEWDISMPQAKYRSHWKDVELEDAIQKCLDWVYENRKEISPSYEFEL